MAANIKTFSYLCGVDEIIEKLSEALSAPLPGWDAQKELINYDRPRPENLRELVPDARQSAVLALLYPKNKELFTVFILRNIYQGVHSGQISFPGGKHEKFDASLWDTALREAHEEVNTEPCQINRIGELTPVYIPPSKFLVTPFLAFCRTEPEFKPDPVEVSKIIQVPVAAFLDRSQILQKKMFIQSLNSSLDIKYFNVEGEVLWGATAMIISELSEIFRKAGVPVRL